MGYGSHIDQRYTELGHEVGHRKKIDNEVEEILGRRIGNEVKFTLSATER